MNLPLLYSYRVIYDWVKTRFYFPCKVQCYCTCIRKKLYAKTWSYSQYSCLGWIKTKIKVLVCIILILPFQILFLTAAQHSCYASHVHYYVSLFQIITISFQMQYREFDVQLRVKVIMMMMMMIMMIVMIMTGTSSDAGGSFRGRAGKKNSWGQEGWAGWGAQQLRVQGRHGPGWEEETRRQDRCSDGRT